MTLEPYRTAEGNPYYPSGLQENADDPVRRLAFESIEKLLATEQFEEAVALAKAHGIGLQSRLQGLLYWKERRTLDELKLWQGTLEQRRRLQGLISNSNGKPPLKGE